MPHSWSHFIYTLYCYGITATARTEVETPSTAPHVDLCEIRIYNLNVLRSSHQISNVHPQKSSSAQTSLAGFEDVDTTPFQFLHGILTTHIFKDIHSRSRLQTLSYQFSICSNITLYVSCCQELGSLCSERRVQVTCFETYEEGNSFRFLSSSRLNDGDINMTNAVSGRPDDNDND